MVQNELKIVVAAIATFVALVGVAVSIHGLLYDENDVVLSGIVAIGVGIAGLVVMLNLRGKDAEEQQHQHQHRES